MLLAPAVLELFNEKLYLANPWRYGRSDTGFGVSWCMRLHDRDRPANTHLVTGPGVRCTGTITAARYLVPA